ncbi:MAG: class I SAM-dependent methyltransferase [Sphingomonadales bacterium]|nr:class I SAM-dependent methyltransferase [Sphingomonadales bacterium]NCO49975.1 class I SAM-dependent methyltransferase [Sphingomonadales bacterium]NCP01479.1 class I SAM-dependent methyltransferase [Sphingomonadales bacterium]NCP26813.1 class I SAM-dependent methyltransferase [Sphingomonadales bacterium]NCP43455.1 class I SAM-dependent methyltransferase [Sphingomonadales bacterium]
MSAAISMPVQAVDHHQTAEHAVIDVVATKAALTASPGRSDEDKARDASRKPAEVLAYLGLKPGDTLLDLIASGGWYSVAAAIATGPEGKVYAQNPAAALQLRDGAYEKEITERLAANNLPQIEQLNSEIADLGVPDDSIDVALTALNFHDVYNGFGAPAAIGMLMAVKAKLKPGGVLGLIDHVGDPDGDNKAAHRIDPALAVAAAEAAGFEVERNDALLAGTNDDHTKNVFDPATRGKTDRFLLKLVKPE